MGSETPVKITTYPNVHIDVQPSPDGKLTNLVVSVVHSHPLGPQNVIDEQIVIPMPIEYAETLGKKLSAPHIVVAPANGKVAA
jgi:hypothetical protein